MLFSDTFTVSAGTTKASPLERSLDLAPGIIHQVDVAFLDGPEHEVEVALDYLEHQIVPTNPEGSLVGNNAVVSTLLHQELEKKLHSVDIRAWSPNADYAHEISVRVHVLPAEVLAPPREELGILQRLSQAILGRR